MNILPARYKPANKQELVLIRSRLLPTWQTAAAIAQHCGLPARTVLAALKRHEQDWALETRMVRIDGHNQVHVYRRRQRILVMGVTFSVEADEEQGEG